MLKSYKYRIYPNKQQISQIEKTFNCCRYVYNKALEYRLDYYQQTGQDIKSFMLCKLLTQWKEQNEWLKEVDSQALQRELRHLDNAFTNFYKNKKNFPKFKSKKQAKKVYTVSYASRTVLKIEQNKIKLAKLGDVKIHYDRIPQGKLMYCTVSCTPTNKYFVSLTMEDNLNYINPKPIESQTAIGIDLGIKDFAILSNGVKIDNPKFLRNNIQRLKVLQRRAAKKKKGSKNRQKANLKVALLHEKIHNQRKDFLHKLTYKLTHDNQVNTLCVENLSINYLLKNHCLSQSIQDCSWYTFKLLLEYKCKWYGKNLIQIGKFEPSTKLCTCGYKNNDLTLADREWTCPVCGTHHDRDILAANNIKKFALNKQNLISTGLVKSEEPLEMLSLDKSMN